MQWDADVLVVGAGVVGLAVGAAVAEAGHSVFIVERHEGPGRETSSRNSEVIHGGLYYPTGSLKARLCVEGNRRLYRFCEKFGLAHRRLGKLIVATEQAEIPELERLYQVGTANGVELRMLGQKEALAMEPQVRAVAALYSPSTGIIDSHNLMKTLEGLASAAGGQALYRAEAVEISPLSEGFEVALRLPEGVEKLRARALVNCAGLQCDRVAALAGVNKYRLHWCKGEYFSVSGAAARQIAHLIYPVPGAHLTSLGTHVTLDLAGRMRLGPDATYIDRQTGSLEIDSRKAEQFWNSARRFLPLLELEQLQPDMVGIRPKLQGPGDSFKDFIIANENENGMPGLFNLIGIESPGLTSSLAIADFLLPGIAAYLG